MLWVGRRKEGTGEQTPLKFHEMRAPPCNNRYLRQTILISSLQASQRFHCRRTLLSRASLPSVGATARNLSAAEIDGSCRSRRRRPLPASVQPHIPEEHARKAHARSAAGSPRAVRARCWHRRSLFRRLGPSCSRQVSEQRMTGPHPSLGDRTNSNPDTSRPPRPTLQCLGRHLCLGSGLFGSSPDTSPGDMRSAHQCLDACPCGYLNIAPGHLQDTPALTRNNSYSGHLLKVCDSTATT
jgi:hypothetical protein